jgi:hypothetical protein
MMKRTNFIFLVVMSLLFAFNCISEVAFAATAPVFTTQPVSATVNVNVQATFSVIVSGTTPITYQWYKYLNGQTTAISGATSPSYTTPPTKVTDNYSSFYVTAKNSAGEVTSNWAQLYVNGPPVITEQPASITVTDPSVVTFNVQADGPSLTFQWYRNGVLVPASEDCTWSTCTTEELTLADNGVHYNVKVSNSYGSVMSTNAVVTVKSGTTGTSPFVGNWSGIAKVTSVNQGSTTYQADATFSQTATTLIFTLVYTDSNDIALPGASMLFVNGLNVNTVSSSGDDSIAVSGAFTANQLTLNLIAVDNNGATGSGAINVSTNLKTMTGSGTFTDPSEGDFGASGTVTWNLTRQ